MALLNLKKNNWKNKVSKVFKGIMPSFAFILITRILRKVWQYCRPVITFPKHVQQQYNNYLQLKNDQRNFIAKYGDQYKKIVGYMQISGFLTDDQAIELFSLANLLGDNSVIVEIGAWQGKSSVLLAKGLQNKLNARLFSIDPFDASGDKMSEDLAYRPSLQIIANEFSGKTKFPLLEKFKKNIKKNQVEKSVSILHGYSHDFSGSFSEPIDLLFIDGNHDYEAVKRDYQEWSTKLKKGGKLVLHDVDFNPLENPTGNEDQVGPGLVAKEYIVNSSVWCEIKMTDNMLIAIRR